MSEPLLPVICARASKRAYDTQPIDSEKIKSVLEAARWAPSSRNNQPWRFVVVQDPDIRQFLHTAFTPSNQAWVGRAPVVVVVCANPTDDDFKEGQPIYLFDSGLAAMSLILQAVHLGLLAHPMMGWSEATVKAVLRIPAEVRVICIIALGFPTTIEVLDPNSRAKDEKPRIRKSLSEIAFFDIWPTQGEGI